jgi:hypothetical protein
MMVGFLFLSGLSVSLSRLFRSVFTLWYGHLKFYWTDQKFPIVDSAVFFFTVLQMNKRRYFLLESIA